MLNEYFNRFNVDISGIPELCEKLPKTITLAQTASVWKHAAIINEEQKQARDN